MLKKVMVVVLLGCVGLTAGLAFGTWWFSSHQPRAQFSALRVQNTCQNDWRLYSPSDLVPNIRGHHPPPGVPGAGTRKPSEHHLAHGGRCLVQLPAMPITGSAPSSRLPLGGYVLFGLLAGLSAALGFLMPPRSSVTAVH
jgi:hypothetical protein